MKTTILNLLAVGTPVLAASEALRAMSGLPWAFAVLLATAIVTMTFAATIVVTYFTSPARAPLSFEKRARVIA